MTEVSDEKITVIVPVYNADKCLDACLASIAGQSFQNLEVLLINDGSTDQSLKICGSWCEKDVRFRLINQENQGVSSARNRGLDQATGSRITFVDADDQLAPDMLKRLTEDLDETGADLAGCSFLTWSNREQLPKNESSGIAADRTFYPNSREIPFIENVFLSGETRIWSKLFLKSAVAQIRFRPDLTIGEDMLFLLEILLRGKKVCLDSYQGYYYYLNEDGAMLRRFKPSYMDQIKCWREAERLLKMEGILPSSKMAEVRIMAVMLTVGKIAEAENSRKNHGDCHREEEKAGIRECSEELKNCLRVKGAFQRLSPGYKVKTILFRICKRLYLSLYKMWKK